MHIIYSKKILTHIELGAAAIALLLLQSPKTMGEEDKGPQNPQIKSLSGMSILGNNEAPKSLVIVPWKGSDIGDGISIENLLDERATPVDKEVFARELNFYRIRTQGADK